jgi:hypothetical protein
MSEQAALTVHGKANSRGGGIKQADTEGLSRFPRMVATISANWFTVSPEEESRRQLTIPRFTHNCCRLAQDFHLRTLKRSHDLPIIALRAVDFA